MNDKLYGFIKRYKTVILFSCTVFLFMGGLLIVNTLVNSPGTKDDVVAVNNNQDDDVLPVTSNKTNATEVLIYPYSGEVTTVRYYYDVSNDQTKQAISLDYFENTYRPSVGMSFSKESKEVFDVLSMFSGTVTSVEKDSIFGNCITIECEDGISIIYQSLSEVSVNENDVVKQGDVIGKSGENIYQGELDNHVHVIMLKDDKTINIENYIDKTIKEIN